MDEACIGSRGMAGEASKKEKDAEKKCKTDRGAKTD